MFKDRMYKANNMSSNTMVQRYLKSIGGRPAITRLFYRKIGQSANYAYFINKSCVK